MDKASVIGILIGAVCLGIACHHTAHGNWMMFYSIEGVLLVIVVLFVFLGDVRSSLIVVATLVLTPLITFMVMNQVGLSANLMSLGGLAIAIGLMVDGSVVVVENAFGQLGRAGRGGGSARRRP
jgi:cobalt-zinc-cadmium resistance protein CzcA